MDRRSFLRTAGGAAATAILASRSSVAEAMEQAHGASAHGHHRRGHAAGGAVLPSPTPARRAPAVVPGQPAMVTPNGSTLPLRTVRGRRVGHLVAEPVRHSFAPGLDAEVWGYNGSSPGPTIEAVVGERLRLYVTNRLPEPTTVHWHGLILPNGMDGVSGLNQPAIPPGETWVYEFTLRHPGTFMYHPHYDEMTQMALGMAGMFVVHPRVQDRPVDRDFALMTHEWKLEPGASRPDPTAMNDFNLLTFNSRAFPGTQPLLVRTGERVRMRFGNLSAMDHHPVHLHGLAFRVTGTDGGDIPASAQVPETTVLVPVGSTRIIEFVPTEPGDWAMHCHMTHHVMTQMGHAPVSIGADLATHDRRMSRVLPDYMSMGTDGMGAMTEMEMDLPTNSLPMRATPGPFGPIDMGGMITILKVRDDPELEPEGWYRHPPGTVAAKADPEDLRADGIG